MKNQIDARTLEHYIEKCSNRVGACKGCSIQNECKELKNIYSVKKLKNLKL